MSKIKEISFEEAMQIAEASHLNLMEAAEECLAAADRVNANMSNAVTNLYSLRS